MFKDTIHRIEIHHLVALDESSVNLAFTRLYGRAKKNERISEEITDVRFERKSILSTVRLNGDMCPFVFQGTLPKEIFITSIKTGLKQTPLPNSVLLLDNSSVHTSRLVLDTLKECNIKYLFLPRYSPDLTPIEFMWAWMKSILKKT